MTNKKLEESQIVLCTVTKIVGTIVFVNIDEYSVEGTITFSEISPGRIRNIRDYVFPGKKIVCKIIDVNRMHLSLRRVKLKEKTELNEAIKKERSFKALLKTVAGDKAGEIIENIKENEESTADFLEDLKEDSSLLEKYLSKSDAEKIIKTLNEKKAKETLIKREFNLSSKKPTGISTIKEIVKQAEKDSGAENIEISYVAAGKYLIKAKTPNPKKTDQQIDKLFEILEDLSKKKECTFAELK